MRDIAATARIFKGTLIPLPGVYTLDAIHTFTEFTTQHLVVGHVRGRFDETTGTITVGDDPIQSSLEVSIATASISTHNAMRDEDLRSPRFFDVAQFPTMTYHSASVVPETDGQWTIEGELVIRDVTRPVRLTASLTGATQDPQGNTRLGVHAHARISRREFGLLADIDRESGGLLIGKDVSISVYAEALLKT